MTIIGLPGQELITKEKHVQDCLDFICYLSPMGPRDRKCNSRLFFSLPPSQVPRDGLLSSRAGGGGPGASYFLQPEDESEPFLGQCGTTAKKWSLLTPFLSKTRVAATLTTDICMYHLTLLSLVLKT